MSRVLFQDPVVRLDENPVFEEMSPLFLVCSRQEVLLYIYIFLLHGGPSTPVVLWGLGGSWVSTSF